MDAKSPEEAMIIRKLNPFVTVLSTPFLRFGKIKFGGRGTLVKLESGGVAVFSPVALTADVKETVTSMGDVKYIAALDFEHHMWIGPWHEAYPNAKVIGVEGLPEKRDKQKNEKVPFAWVFTKDNKDTLKIDPEFDAEFEYEFIPGHTNKELVFLHKPSKTLIEGDLLLNLPATEQFSKAGIPPTTGILTKLFTAIGNTNGEAIGQRRLLWYATGSKDLAFNSSIAKINSWDFQTIVPCHGEVIDSNAKGVFQRVFQWHLDAYKTQAKKSD